MDRSDARAFELAREERLAEAERIAHIGSWEWDAVTNHVTWSDELCRIYGLPVGSPVFTYEQFLERVHPADRELTRERIAAALRDGGPLLYEHRILRPDGSVRMLHTRGEVVRDPSGVVRGLVGLCWDVTERWEAGRRLVHSHALLEATLESTQDGIVVVDLAGEVVRVNRRALVLWQVPDEVAATRDVRRYVEHVRSMVADPEAFVARELELLADRSTETLETIRFRDGRVFERYTMPQRLGADVVGRVCSFRDVTERERLLERAVFLADASRLLASLDVEAALPALASRAIPVLGDSCAIELFDEPSARFVGSRTGAPEPPRPPRSVRVGRSHPGVHEERSFLAVPLVARGTVLGAISVVAAADRTLDAGLVEELARRATLAIENARLYRRSVDAVHARDEFIAVASHELRGPLGALHLAVQNLLRGANDRDREHLLRVVERADLRLSRFLDDLLEVTRIRGGELRLERERVDLSEVVREVLEQFAADLARSGSSASVELPGSVVGAWDRDRIAQVVAGLISNAVKFGLGRPIHVRLVDAGDRAVLTVADHGLGIPAERIGTIFEPFERAVAAGHYGGLGLGLYVARTIVEGLGGTIRVASEPRRGSTFTVELPKGATAQEARAA